MNYNKAKHYAQSVLAVIAKSPLIQTGLLFSFVFAFFTPIYNELDDVQMVRIANGTYTGEPLPFLYHINIILGKFFAALYSFKPDINWYTYILYITLFASLYALCIILTKLRQRTPVMAHCLYAMTGIMYTWAIIEFQYVTFASLAVFSGLLLLLFFFNNEEKRRTLLILSLLLIIMGALFRIRAGYLGLLLCAPLFFYTFKKLTRDRKIVLGIVSAALVILMASFQLYDRHVYLNDNRTKADLTWADLQFDYSAYSIYSYELQENSYRRAGWSKNDSEMLNSWSYNDETIFSSEKLKAVMNGAKSNPISTDVLTNALKTFFINLFSGNMFLLIGIMFTINWLRNNKSGRRSIYGTLIIFVGVYVLYAYLGRLFPSRLGYPLAFFLSIFTVALNHKNFKDFDSRSFSASRVFFVSTLLYMCLHIVLMSSANSVRIAQFKKMLGYLPEKEKAHIYVWDSGFPIQWMSPLDSYKDIGKYSLSGFGWAQRLYPDRALLKSHKIENFYTSLYERDDIFIIVKERELAILGIFMKEHFNTEIWGETIYSFHPLGFSSRLVKIHKK